MATKAKSASAKLAGGASKVKSQSSSDVFLDVAKEVENLNQEKAFALVHDLSEGVDKSNFRLGGILAHIQDKSNEEGGEAWLNGKANFKELIELEFGLHYRKAMYLVEIYKALVENQIPWDTVKDVGWTKLIWLSKILTAKNAESWAKKAMKMTVTQVIAAVKKQIKPGSEAKETKTLTFKVHEDQAEAITSALSKAKEETKTEYDTVALYNIAQGYLGNSVEIKTVGGEAEAPAEEAGEAKEPAKKLSAKAEKVVGLMAAAAANYVLETYREVAPDTDIVVSDYEPEAKKKEFLSALKKAGADAVVEALDALFNEVSIELKM